MTSDVREAAEILRTKQEHEYPDYAYMDGAEGSFAYIDDLRTLAHAYLAEHPSDSDVPIDQGFLMDLGFQLIEPSRSVVIWKLGELWLVCTALGNEWKWNGYLIESWPKTRGDVRRLCAALGLELKEAGNGEA